MTDPDPQPPTHRWSLVLLLGAVLVATALHGSRWSVCSGRRCAALELGGTRVAVADAAPQSDAVAERVWGEVDAGCHCCGDQESEADRSGGGDRRAPLGSLLPLRPDCCAVLALDLVPLRTALDDAPEEPVAALAPRRLEECFVGSQAPTARHRQLGRGPPRPDRTTALRSCTVLLL